MSDAARKPKPRIVVRPGGEQYTVAQVEQALRQSAGISALAANALGCTPKTVRNYLRRHQELRAVVDDLVETSLDLAESKLIQSLNNGERWAVLFYLETKGKGRGYTRRQEITGVAGKPIEITDARERLLGELKQMGQRLKIAAPADPGPVARRANGAANGAGAGPADQETVG
jgi:hypothetical protein